MKHLPQPPRGFKHVPGFLGYAVNRSGRVLSCRRRGAGLHIESSWRVLHVLENSNGYATVHIRKSARTARRKWLVHRLMLLTFRGPCPRGMEACHWNGVRSDNRLRNLRWDTQGANYTDRCRHGRGIRGEAAGNAKLTERQVRAIILSKGRGCPAVLAARYGVSVKTIYQIREGTSWKHIHKTLRRPVR